jgi:hypothetical protein
MVDGNNIPPEMAKLVTITDHNKPGKPQHSARNSFLKASFYSSNAPDIPIPS